MKHLVICILLICMADRSHAQNTEKEKVVKAYYSGFEKKDWNAVGIPVC